MREKILVVDDEENISGQLAKLLKIEGWDTMSAQNGLSALKLISQENFDLIVTDLKMPAMDGQQLVENLRKDCHDFPIIMMSAYGFASDVVKALKAGADDYVVKPFDPDELVFKITKLLETRRMKKQIQSLTETIGETSELIGESQGILKIKESCSGLSDSLVNVLIMGESGTGKEVLARYIHSHSPHKNGEFVPVNMASIPEGLVESELFGHEKGSFTGAVATKQGLFEIAEGGTIFLDEIGDAPQSLQVKLLRVLQERVIYHVGGNKGIPVNARVIAATNRKLEEDVKAGKFREDLYYRLNVVSFTLSPLRERKEDIILLSTHLIAKLNKQLGKNITSISPEAQQALLGHKFYGNVRELENTLERAMIFASGNTINLNNLEFHTLNKSQDVSEGEKTSAALPYSGQSLEMIEKEAIKNALLRNDGNRTKTAEELKISRRTLINKIAELGLE